MLDKIDIPETVDVEQEGIEDTIDFTNVLQNDMVKGNVTYKLNTNNHIIGDFSVDEKTS